MAPQNELSLALAQSDWAKATVIAQGCTALASTWVKREGFFDGVKKSHCLALHEACLVDAPKSTVKAILKAHPDAVRTKESAYSRLPLHCACRRSPADPSIIAMLLQSHRAACLVPDAHGRLPIYYALSNRADSTIIHMLLSAQPDSAKGVDEHGWSPLHVACATGNHGAIGALLQLYPEAVILRTDKGSTPSMCLSKTMEGRDEIKGALRRARQQFDAQFVNPLTRRNMPLIEAADVAMV
jgi:Ankyrin repeats (3 copies)